MFLLDENLFDIIMVYVLQTHTLLYPL